MVRSTTTRPNIQYRVGRFDSDNTHNAVAALMHEKRQQYPLPGQIIMYCRSVTETKELAEVLGGTAYFREVGDYEHKRRLLNRLISGYEQVFTATNALGIEIDRASIRVVIHVDVPRSMASFAQESGRVGRNGLPSESIIMWPGRPNRQGWLRLDNLESIDREMRPFINGSRCRRVVLDSVMNGQTKRLSYKDGEERCGVCHRRGTTRSSVENGQKRSHESDVEDKQASKHARESSSIITRPKAPEGDSLATPPPTQREEWSYARSEQQQ